MSLSPSQRAKDDVLQKEVKVKILKDSIHLLVSRSPPSAGGGGQQLTSELEGVLANYHKLCDRFKSKCHTLEVTCSAPLHSVLPVKTAKGSGAELDVAFHFKPRVVCCLSGKKRERKTA